MKNTLKDNSGATAIEYALIASVIFMVVLVSMIFVGDSTNQMWEQVYEAVSNSL